jgi:hypothetical protein
MHTTWLVRFANFIILGNLSKREMTFPYLPQRDRTNVQIEEKRNATLRAAKNCG